MSARVLNLEEYAKKIKACWRRSVEAILQTAKLCAEADEKLNANEKKTLKEHLPFGAACFSMYVQIGSDPWFDEKENTAKLPASYSTMYCVTGWSPELREAAIKNGVLHPGATRAELVQFKEEQTESELRQSPQAEEAAVPGRC